MNALTPHETAVAWAARLHADEPSARRITDLLGELFVAENVAVALADAGSGRWSVSIHFGDAPDEDAVRAAVAAAAGRDAAAALRFERLAGRDWVRESLAGLKPVAAGRFIVHGAHDRAGVPVNRLGIEIEAALAFGTGHHGTTRGCLLALDRLAKSAGRRREQNILDVGTGSGVLAIAAARLFRQRVLATDIDPDALRIARANARLNDVAPLTEFVRANGVAVRAVRTRAPFDLVFANILLGPLQRMAAPLQRLAAPGGRLVLSGLLSVQATAARAAYSTLALERRIELDGWTTLVLTRRRRRGARQHGAIGPRAIGRGAVARVRPRP